MILSGVVIGTLLLNLMMGYKGSVLVEQVAQYHHLIQRGMESSLHLFFRICLYRVGIGVILVACIRLMDNYYVFYPALFLGGISFGYTLSLLSICYGLSGVGCMIVYLCPHYLIYIPLIYVILRETSSQMYKAFSPDLRRTVVIFALIILGCGAESYLNPLLLKIFLKNFL